MSSKVLSPFLFRSRPSWAGFFRRRVKIAARCRFFVIESQRKGDVREMKTYELKLTEAEAATLVESLPQTTVEYCGVNGIIPDDETKTILIVPSKENATIRLTRKSAAWLAAALNRQIQKW